MSNPSNFSIKSQVEFTFNNSTLRNNTFNSFYPEVKKLNTTRSKFEMRKEGDLILLFLVESTDITAFRATMNDLIGFGKIIEHTTQLAQS